MRPALLAAFVRPPTRLASSAAAVLLLRAGRAAERQRLIDVELDGLRRAHIAPPAAQPCMLDGRRSSRLRISCLGNQCNEASWYKNTMHDYPGRT